MSPLLKEFDLETVRRLRQEFSSVLTPGNPALVSTIRRVLSLTPVVGGTEKLSTVHAVATGSATVANSTTEATLLGTVQGTLTLPVNFFTIGKSIRVIARGVISTAAVPGTLNIRVRLGGVAGTEIVTTAAQTMTASLTNRGWELDSIITCRTTGASGTVFGQGWFRYATSATDIAGWDMENSSSTTRSTLASQQVQVTAQFGTADASNSLTCSVALVEVLYR